MKLNKSLISLLAILFLGGCASGYKEFYKPASPEFLQRVAAQRAGTPPAIPLVERAQPADSQTVLDAYAKRGYVMIGSSLFNSGRPETDDAAIQQAKKVGADLVLILNPKYTGSVTSAVPITTPTTTTSYSSGTATAYGPGGPVTAYGTGSTTTYGTTTNYIPMTVHRSDYGAVFFVKQRFEFGAFTRDLNDTERQELQTNRGAAIRLVVDASPAFNADILVGDIITSINDLPVTNSQHLITLLQERKGQLVSLSLLRRGQRIEKSVQLNP